MAEIVEFAVDDLGAGRGERALSLPCHLDLKHPVQRAVYEIERQTAQSLGRRHLGHQRMERG